MDKVQNAIALATSPVVRALVDPEGAMRDIRNLDKVRRKGWLSVLQLWFSGVQSLGEEVAPSLLYREARRLAKS